MDFIRHHVLLLVLVLAGLATFLWLLKFRGRLRMTWWAALLLSVVHVFFGVLCVRVFARMEGASVGSMSIFGAVFFMPVGYYVGSRLFKRPVAEVFDIFAIPMIFTLLCSRFNCLASGCCYGLNIGSTSLRWPTREAEILFYIIFLLIMAPKVWKGISRGRVYPVYMIAYGIFRGIVEFFRYSSTTTNLFHLSHVWALVSLVTGVCILLAMKKRDRKIPASADAEMEDRK